MIAVIPPFRGMPLTNDIGGQQLPTQIMSEWMEVASRLIEQLQVAEGSGSPEGILDAGVNKLYRDIAGAPGAILYIKTTATGNTGWVTV
jgi:hypothetical protein